MSSAPTIVMTQRGARKDFQESLRVKGVEVVQFDFLTPEAVAAYCYERGFLQVGSSPTGHHVPLRAFAAFQNGWTSRLRRFQCPSEHLCGRWQVLWECGGTLAAPAIAAGVIHKALAFIAPKLVGAMTCC